MASLAAIWQGVEKGYYRETRRPGLLMGRTTGTSICIVTSEKLERMPWKDVQRDLAMHHLVVRAPAGYKEPSFKEALQDLGSLDTVMTIHGMWAPNHTCHLDFTVLRRSLFDN